MNNQEIDQHICEAVRLGLARTQGELIGYLAAIAKANNDPMEVAGTRTVDNALRRSKDKGILKFDKERKEWDYVNPGLPPIDHIQSRPTVVPSGESAPAGEASLQSEGQAQQPREEDQNMNSKSNVAEIDSQIAAAKTKAKGSSSGEASGTKRPRLTAEEKTARDTARAAEREAKRLEREKAREAKKLEREQNRKSPHMSKVDKAFSKLPSLNSEASELFGEITANFSRDQLSALAAHLNHFNRTKATERALQQKLAAGDTVKINSGDPRFIGQTGTVTKAQRIRCYVEVPGAKKPVYLFTSDVELVKQAATAKAS